MKRIVRIPLRAYCRFVKKLLLFCFLFVAGNCSAQTGSTKGVKSTGKSNWYDRISIRGYAQVRYNRLLETNPELKCEQCDRSMGEDGGFFIRRLRVIFFGQIHERVYFYIQPDFASNASTNALHFGQIRDAYMDLGLDKHNEFRFRVGQSKIPFGFENMQSSQNRLPLDRNDALNSALANERDLGVFFYWAPGSIRKGFSTLISEGLKGSGDYGVFGFGAFNGQTANRPDLNNQLHYVARASYPLKLGNQIIEPGIQGYTGEFVIPADQISTGTKVAGNRSYVDQRVAASFVLYPQPFGIQAEYNIGRGPEFDAGTDSIETRKLTGGYITLNYKFEHKGQLFYPFLRGQYYNGGKKHELDARSYKVNEIEAGLEWQPNRYFEMVAQYTMSSRRFEDFKTKGNFQEGSLLRLQLQVNF
ncbi:MAG: porin [Chitinophagaceae bacterium]|nr:MAG: porin [Chitinophagaceae bacterium]